MKSLVGLVFIVLLLIHGPTRSADDNAAFSDAQRIVAITASEGIHYGQGCAFFELRALLVRALGEPAKAGKSTAEPDVEFRLLGVDDVQTAYLRDHSLETDGRAYAIADEAYQRILELLAQRKGSGVKKDKVSKSIKRALRQIQSPTYKEVIRCTDMKSDW